MTAPKKTILLKDNLAYFCETDNHFCQSTGPPNGNYKHVRSHNTHSQRPYYPTVEMKFFAWLSIPAQIVPATILSTQKQPSVRRWNIGKKNQKLKDLYKRDTIVLYITKQ